MNHFIRNLVTGSAVAALAFGAVVVCSGLVNADTKIPIDEAHFPDKAFREEVKYYYDTDGDGYLSSAERNDDDHDTLRVMRTVRLVHKTYVPEKRRSHSFGDWQGSQNRRRASASSLM